MGWAPLRKQDGAEGRQNPYEPCVYLHLYASHRVDQLPAPSAADALAALKAAPGKGRGLCTSLGGQLGQWRCLSGRLFEAVCAHVADTFFPLRGHSSVQPGPRLASASVFVPRALLLHQPHPGLAGSW